MPKLRPSAPRNHGRWRPAGVARLGVVLLVVAFVALTFNLILSSKGNSDSSTTTRRLRPRRRSRRRPHCPQQDRPRAPRRRHAGSFSTSDHRLHLTQIRDVDEHRTRLRPEHDVPPHDDVYNSSGTLLKTISDGVALAHFGVRGRPGLTHGAPVEAP